MSSILQPGLLDQDQRFFWKNVVENRAAQLIGKKINYQIEKAACQQNRSFNGFPPKETLDG